jgi:Flp pilus assembly protein TadB
MPTKPESATARYRSAAILITAGCLLLTAAVIVVIMSPGERKGLSLVPLAAGIVVALRLRRRLARRANEEQNDMG